MRENIPKFRFFFKFKDGVDLKMESFSCKQSLHTFSPGANGFTLLTISHFILYIPLCHSLSANLHSLMLTTRKTGDLYTIEH